MKNSIYKDKFIATNFVKPLYQVKFAKTPKLFSDIDTRNLVGDAFNVSNSVPDVTIKDTHKYKILPGACEVYKHYDLSCDKGEKMQKQDNDKDILSDTSNRKRGSSDGRRQHISSRDPMDLDLDNEEEQEETWLRVRPAPHEQDETIGSVALRHLACQLGVTVFIIIWTAIWVAAIHSFEGPNENKVSAEYAEQQNQLVVDLATELRMITPISPKWHTAILARINEARKQTMLAAGRGAKADPGRYWDLAGTFLFTVFVMTALGFGAPVPQTVGGRCSALLYAIFAIPFHVYLMMQASTCAVAHVNRYLARCHRNINRPIQTTTGSLHHRDLIGTSKLHRNIDTEVTTGRRRRKKLSRLFAVVTAGHCVPLATVLYYVVGMLIFGLGRYYRSDNLEIMDVLMFPLQFTTNGGLAMVESYYRVLYGFYVEGAMALLTCSVAALRRYSGRSVSHMTEKYRLFTKG